MKLNRANLHEYQKYGVDFIINNPISALMLECGLGKTITTLTAVSDLMYDYFEIFLERMMLCRKAAEILGTTFKLTVNGRKVL